MTNSVNKKVISPVYEQGQGYVFNAAGRNFKITGSHIELLEKTNDVFESLVAAQNLFTFTDSTIEFYYDYNSKTRVSKVEEGALENFDKILDLTEKVSFLKETSKNLKVSGKGGNALTEVTKELAENEAALEEAYKSSTVMKFTYNNEDKTYKAGKIEFAMANQDSLAEMCFASGYIKYEDKALLETFQRAGTNFDNYKILDFVTEIKSNSYTTLSMRAERNAFVYRINEETKISKFSKFLADAAIEFVAEQTGENVSEMFEDILESFEERRKAKQEKVNLFKEMLSFLHDQKGRLAEADRNLPDIKAANNLISSEITRISEELDDLQNEELLGIEDGYVNATINGEVEGLAADAKLKVDAVEYNQAGKNDILTVFHEDSPFRIEKFKINISSDDTL